MSLGKLLDLAYLYGCRLFSPESSPALRLLPTKRTNLACTSTAECAIFDAPSGRETAQQTTAIQNLELFLGVQIFTNY